MRKKTIVFVICPGRSGSTVFSKFLGTHSKCFSVSEIHYFDAQIKADKFCSCEKKYSECSFWKSVIKDVDTNLKPIESFNTSSVPFFKSGFILSKLYRYVQLYIYYFTGVHIGTSEYFEQIKNEAELLKIVSNKLDEDFIIDSSKNAVRAIYLSRVLKDDFDFKYIILNRDIRANVYSQLKQDSSVVVNGQEVTYSKKDVPLLEEATNNWVKITRNFNLLNSLFKLKAAKIIYEDFTLNPKQEFKKVENILGVSWEESMLDLSNCNSHMLGGNLSRIKAKSIHPPKEEWKNFTNDELAYINKYEKKYVK